MARLSDSFLYILLTNDFYVFISIQMYYIYACAHNNLRYSDHSLRGEIHSISHICVEVLAYTTEQNVLFVVFPSSAAFLVERYHFLFNKFPISIHIWLHLYLSRSLMIFSLSRTRLQSRWEKSQLRQFETIFVWSLVSTLWDDLTAALKNVLANVLSPLIKNRL